MDQDTTMESLGKTRTVGKFRCLNCFERGSALPGAKTWKCPGCGFEFRLSWISPTQPRIRGPIWEVNRRLAEEAMSNKEETGKE